MRELTYWKKIPITHGCTYEIVRRNLVKENEIGSEAFNIILKEVKSSDFNYQLRLVVLSSTLVEQRQ